MEIKNIQKGRISKSCTVVGAANPDEAFEAVLSHFKESRVRLFGWLVMTEPLDGSIDVLLYTD